MRQTARQAATRTGKVVRQDDVTRQTVFTRQVEKIIDFFLCSYSVGIPCRNRVQIGNSPS